MLECGKPMQRRAATAFTLTELLVVIAIIGILAALLFPVLSRAKANGQRAACMNNLMQIAKGVRMYADDSSQILFPIIYQGPGFAFYEWTAYNPMMRSYVGLKGPPSPQDKLFACPADTFFWGGQYNVHDGLIFQSEHLQSNTCYSSYAMNAGNAVVRSQRQFPGMFAGILGTKLTSVAMPARTVLLAEFSALDGYSWHQPAGRDSYNNAPSVLSFTDGHVGYTKMYYGSNNPTQIRQHPFAFNPPSGYDYRWTAD
jgi:prepilin-type N-terminal cleavage/methylation domain-containing protein